jgi:quinol monooxygenase YgiN
MTGSSGRKERQMAAFIYVGTTRVKRGRLSELRRQLADLAEFVETNEPRMIAFHTFLDEPGEKLSIVQVHPDSAWMEFHMKVNAKHFATAFDNLDAVVSEQYYGAISDSLASELAKWDDATVAVTRMPVHESGFTRSNIR